MSRFINLNRKKIHMNEIRTRTIVEFLRLKGWEISANEQWYVSCKAPEKLGLKEHNTLRIPLDRYRNAPHYEESIEVVLKVLSVAYQRPVAFYQSLFNRAIQELSRPYMEKDVISKDTLELINVQSH